MKALCAFVLIAFWSGAALAQSSEQIEYFEKNVRPVLVQNCQPCHNLKMKSSGLDLSTASGFLSGGAGGLLVAKDHPESSRLLQVVGYEDSVKMPPTGKLKAEQIESLTNWVKMGAPWPGADQMTAQVKPAPKKEFTAEQKAFWAFQPVANPELPFVKDTQWVRTPIDRFILAKLEQRGLRPAPPASRTTLLRRATFDLTGLPPTEKELQDFIADGSPDAYAKVVDRLLASPRYGERWGRHWLDVARYADSTGNDEDHRYPYAWRYRDYVIDSFNNDLPYNQFVREQIAGDLLPPPAGEKFNARGVVATGFLALGAKAIAQVDKKKMLYDVWDEQVDVTSKAFLGLTMACARCHDHKFDPILTKDYYSMVGMFASTRSFDKVNQGVASLLYRPLVPESEYKVYRAYLAKTALETLNADEIVDSEVLQAAKASSEQVAEYMLATRTLDVGSVKSLDVPVLAKWMKVLAASKEAKPWLDEWNAATRETAPAVAARYQKRYRESLAEWAKMVEKSYAEARKKLEAGEPDISKVKREFKDPFFSAVFFRGGPFLIEGRNREKGLSPEWKAKVASYRAAAELLKKNAPVEPDMADAVSEDTPVQQKVMLRGDFNNPGEDAPRAVPAVLTKVAPGPAAYKGSGRAEVADWLTHPENPLVARVMVNRAWMWHFGEGIVSTPDNFGKMGARPSNPELLDYLATQFVANGWSLKKMHRLMMLSNTYRMAADTDTKTISADPENVLLSRFQRQRLDIEEIRDGMLAVDGSLDLTMHGTLQKGFGTDKENSSDRLSMNPELIRRRTVYLPLRRANLPTLLNLFDFGDATTVNGKRAMTNVSPQALFMMNSEFVAERARKIAKAVLEDANLTDRARVERIYLRTLDRKPAPDEIDGAFTYMDRMKRKFGRGDLDAWQSFCHILLTSNEFIYLD
ncbi:MAG: PSD1 and planctomycete cytochrome C domain-containing protein [Acidobacteriota bacterium]|nr:PSD1 and planctomycete cytochrome C domain-containing protein [Acidobacteriota bacterium]